MHIYGLFVWRPTRAQQGVNQADQPISLADDDLGVFFELCTAELFSEQLGRAAKAAERVFNFVGELANHLSACAVLYEQGVLAAYACSPGHIDHFDQEALSAGARVNGRHATFDSPFFGVNLTLCELQLTRIGHIVRQRLRKDLCEPSVVIDQRHERMAASPAARNAKEVLGRWIELSNEMVCVKQDYGRVEALKQLVVVGGLWCWRVRGSFVV
jgi:hypothetical protein